MAEGVDPREAWKRCDKPKGEAGIQNIRKAGFKLRKLGTVAPKQPSQGSHRGHTLTLGVGLEGIT